MSLYETCMKIINLFMRKEVPLNFESNHSLIRSKEFNRKNPRKPLPIDINRAKLIHLPQLRFTKDSSIEERDRNEDVIYWSSFNAGLDYYRNKRYQRAKECFLKIYEMNHRSSSYFTYLLRTYRKLVDNYILEQIFNKAKNELLELFSKCPNATNSDIKKYNKLIDKIGETIDNKDFFINMGSDFIIISDHISFLHECKKPRGYKYPPTNNISINNLIKLSDLLPTSLRHISFDADSIEYISLDYIPYIENDVYRFRESLNRNAFIMSSKELIIYLYDHDLNLLSSFNASRFSKHYYHLRRVELASSLNLFMFTNIDKAYLLDSKFNLVGSWEVPSKEGWRKVKRELNKSPIDIKVKECQNILGLGEFFTQEEIKSSFRRLAFQYHPDKNPGNPHANERMKEIIGAYEYLTKEEAKGAFKGMSDEEYWEKVINTHKIEVAGISLTINISIGGPGEDWIYGSGISNDGSRIYLGCYSGKIYQINKNGIAEKIYIIPEDKDGIYGKTNPVTYIFELNDFLYIISYWYLYIIKDNKLVKYVELNKYELKWFDSGFISKLNNDIKVFANNGDLLGSISVKGNINNICYKNNILLVETNNKAYTFLINSIDKDLFEKVL